MKYIVYLTTNKVNNKIYIGVHQTDTPDKFDGYLGCGAYANKPSSYNKCRTHLHSAILKYGPSSFYRITLRVFNKLEDALDLEAWLVTDEFVKRTDTYNMTLGGSVPPKSCKVIYQFDLKGNLIKAWDEIKDITESYGINKDRIAMCIKDKRSFDNSYWSEENQVDISQYRLSSRGYVYQYNKDGELLNVFKNASEAALKLDIAKQAIVGAVYAKSTRSGYYFLRADDDINQILASKSKIIHTVYTPVYRYTLDGKFDKEYPSISLAVKDTPKSSTGNIIRAIKNDRVCANYRWSYTKSDIIDNSIKYIKPTVKVAQYDKQHNLIKIWDSVTECQKQYPYCRKVCRHERKSTAGFIFEYIS